MRSTWGRDSSRTGPKTGREDGNVPPYLVDSSLGRRSGKGSFVRSLVRGPRYHGVRGEAGGFWVVLVLGVVDTVEILSRTK